MDEQPPAIEHYISRDQGRIYARDYPGAEPTFVLMHGFPDNLHIWDYLIPHLVAGGRRVVAFDSWDSGRRTKCPALPTASRSNWAISKRSSRRWA